MRTLLQLIETDKQLLRDIFLSMDDAVHKKGKRVHLRFARPTRHGWSFFTKKTISWDLLDDIMHHTIKRHPHCHRAKIAETISRFINLSEKEMASLRTAVL